jgi:SAM-dependent methyltransferase
MDAPLHVQYGAGLCGPPGWLNYDASPMILLQRTPGLNLLPIARRGAPYPKTVRFGDVVRGLPVKSGTADLVYCSHTLEHLALADCRTALRETHRMLKAGGTFRAVLPDIRYLCEEYLRQAATDPAAAVTFIRETHMGLAEAPRGLAKLRSLFSRSFHHWMWDYPAMELELRAAGFRTIRPARYQDSVHAAFRDVEEPHRWEHALGFEAVK